MLYILINIYYLIKGSLSLFIDIINTCDKNKQEINRCMLFNSVSINEFNLMASSIRHNAASNNEAIYTDSVVTGRDILVRSGGGIIGTGVTVECFRVPVAANWAYVVVSGVALYNSSVSTDFELHRSEEDTLTHSILTLAGIVINKSGLAQTASQMSSTEQQIQNT